ncbi:hypothetical protein FKM82_003718 [Ascaphus truei]
MLNQIVLQNLVPLVSCSLFTFGGEKNMGLASFWGANKMLQHHKYHNSRVPGAQNIVLEPPAPFPPPSFLNMGGRVVVLLCNTFIIEFII